MNYIEFTLMDIDQGLLSDAAEKQVADATETRLDRPERSIYAVASILVKLREGWEATSATKRASVEEDDKTKTQKPPETAHDMSFSED